MKKQDKVDSWVFNSLIKTIIDALITLLRFIRPQDKKPQPPKPNKPYSPLPEKPLFPWLRKKIDNIFTETTHE